MGVEDKNARKNEKREMFVLRRKNKSFGRRNRSELREV